jgi:hypothetical protein
MVNDLIPATDLVKFVDDSTTWEVLHRDSQSNLPSAVKAREEWSCDNNKKLNASKTKEMRVNFSSSSPSYPPIAINNQTVNIVTQAKLLGVTISNDLKWNLHVNSVCKKASKRLYSLRLLKRNALQDSILVKVYRACVRPIVEYACEAWHYNLPAYLNNQIEQIQKRALRIIYPSFTYHKAVLTANIPSLYDCRSTLCKRIFDRMLDPGHKLNSLVLALKITNTKYAIICVLGLQFVEPNRYHKSFIPSVASLYDTNHF